MKTNERLKMRETSLRLEIVDADWFGTTDREVMSGIDGAMYLVGKASLSETELAKLHERLKTARVSHDLPKLDPRVAKPGLGYTEEELKGLPSEASFVSMLGEIKNALFVKKDALIAKNRVAIRQMRGFGKARKAIHNLLRDHAAGARRALGAMAEGGPTPSWILRSVAVAAKG